ncbi:MAG: hypothetical protein SFW65_04395 [Alphaproteobacteria bacterium]|nr:hypothetical protein [Alphaproteobacteria bacterium]
MTNENSSSSSLMKSNSTINPKSPHIPGTTRATIAFIFSLLALGISGYQLWSTADVREGKVVSPLMTEKSSSDMESRLKAQENTLTVMNDTFKKQFDTLQQKLAEIPAPSKDTAELSGTAAAVNIKMADWEKQNAELRQQIKAELLAKSKNIAALAVLEHITRKAQLGLSFQNDVKELEATIIPNETSAHAYNLLKGFDKPLTSDTALLNGLHALTPDFLAREKLDKADGLMDKIGIQLQKLVVVRKKNGQVDDGTPIGKSLDELQTAIVTGDWPKATSIASTFAEKNTVQLPKGFAEWQEKLRDRALTEEAVNALQHLVLNDLKDVSIPVAEPTMSASPVAAPVEKPLIKKVPEKVQEKVQENTPEEPVN